MIPTPGYVYFLNDEFFELFGIPSSSKICCNKGAGHGRPYYCCKKDHGSDLYWMIPMTTKLFKYRQQHEKQLELYGKCITITLTKFAGKTGAVLIQNAVPVHPHYIDNQYIKNGNPIPLHTTVQKIIYANLQQSIALHNRGHQIFFPDVDYVKELQLSLAERDFQLPLDRKIASAFRQVTQTEPRSRFNEHYTKSESVSFSEQEKT